MKVTLKIFIILCLTIFSGNTLAQNNSADIKAALQKAYELFNSHDVTREKASMFVDDNYIDHTPDPGQPAGIEGLVYSFANFKKGFPDYKITANIITVAEDGNSATVLITITGTNTGEMMGMPPTGKPVSFTGIDYLIFKDKKCTERWGYFDQMGMMQQLGLLK